MTTTWKSCFRFSARLFAFAWLFVLAPGAGVSAAPLPYAVVVDSLQGMQSALVAAAGYNNGRVLVVGLGRYYHLSDGTVLRSGAGSSTSCYAYYDHTEVSGDTIRYFLNAPADSVAYYVRDYNPGIVASLSFVGPLEIRAIRGSTTATLVTTLRVRINSPTRHGPVVYFLGAQVGREVPCHVTFTNRTAPWSETSFISGFTYDVSGMVDFRHALPPGALVGLEVLGPADVTSPGSSNHRAIASYWGGLRLDVSGESNWTVSGLPGASIVAGQLSVPEVHGGIAPVQLHAEYPAGPAALDAPRDLAVHAAGVPPDADSWPMYQADASHTGYRPVRLYSHAFSVLWSRRIADYRLNSVVAVGGRVFCTLVGLDGTVARAAVALDARTGARFWATPVGSPFGVNPPSWSDGLITFATVNSADDTWLWILRESDGSVVSKILLDSQWQQVFAPTIYDRTIYTCMGYFGGMFAVHADDGVPLWHDTDLPQTDRWTPAVDEGLVYLHQYSTNPMLIAVDRHTGATAWTIPNQSIQSGAGAVDGAPVLGGYRDAITMQGTSLYCYDLDSLKVRWKLDGQFFGQPSVAKGVVYAINGNALVALHERDSHPLWSWQVPSGSLTGAVIVTDSHLFCTNGASTFAIGLDSHATEWSLPVGGALALAGRTLFIANLYGTLTAVEMGDIPVPAFVQRFEGAAGPEGNALLWQFGESDGVAAVVVERATRRDGEWEPLEGEAQRTPAGSRFIDAAITPGVAYWYRLRVRPLHGSEVVSETILVEPLARTDPPGLVAVGPVPASRTLSVAWTESAPMMARLRLLDIQGRCLQTLFEGAVSAGTTKHTLSLPGDLRPGVYLLRYDAGARQDTRRIVVVR